LTKGIFELIKEEADACINCGLCDAVCPTLSAFDYQEIMGARGRMIMAKKISEDFLKKGYSDFFIRDVYYSCLECDACREACSAGLNPGHVSNLVKQAISTDQIKNQKHMIAEMITELVLKYKDPLGLKKELTEWSKGLEFENSYETILYTGHIYQLMAYIKKLGEMLKFLSLDNPSFIFSKFYDKKIKERSESQLKNIYILLKKAGVKFSYLGEEEPYPGTLLIDMGYVNEFKQYAQWVTDLFHKKGVKNIITVDPHTYDLLINRYPAYAKGFDFNITHYLDYIGSINFRSTSTRVTYHEPCHFVRHANYEEPFKILTSTSKLIMPVHSGKNTYCCGGPIEAFYPEAADKISQKRFRELKETDAEEIVTACPICYVNLAKDDSVKDISEYLIERL